MLKKSLGGARCCRRSACTSPEHAEPQADYIASAHLSHSASGVSSSITWDARIPHGLATVAAGVATVTLNRPEYPVAT